MPVYAIMVLLASSLLLMCILIIRMIDTAEKARAANPYELLKMYKPQYASGLTPFNRGSLMTMSTERISGYEYMSGRQKADNIQILLWEEVFDSRVKEQYAEEAEDREQVDYEARQKRRTEALRRWPEQW